MRLYDGMSQLGAGHPRTYARWGTNIEVVPVPTDATGTLRVRYWEEASVVTATSTTVIITPPAWDALLQWETLYRLYFITGQEDKAAALVMPMPMPRQPSPKRTRLFEVGIIPRLWNDLLTTYNMREAVDEDFSVNPIRRPYISG